MGKKIYIQKTDSSDISKVYTSIRKGISMRKLSVIAFFIAALPLFPQEEALELQSPTEEISWNPRTPPRSQQQKSNPALTPSTIPPAVKPFPIKTAEAPKQNVSPQHKSHLQIGANYTYAHVRASNGPSTTGNLGGIQALYEFKIPNRIYGGVTFAWREGNTTGSGTSRSILEFDTQERIGYTWGTYEKDFFFSLFSGFGYRHFGEKVSASGNSVRFNYNEFYFPVGFLLKGRLNSFISMGLNLQWMPQVYPTVSIIPLKGARWILNSELSNVKIEAPITFYLTKSHNLSLLIQPFFEYWKDGHTSAKTQQGVSLNVPGNKYLFGGADLNLCYSF